MQTKPGPIRSTHRSGSPAMAASVVSHLLLWLLLPATFPRLALCAPLRSVPELDAAMYKVLDATPCVRLLNLTGEVGCANPGRLKVRAPIWHVADLSTSLPEPVSVLLPSSQLREFLSRGVHQFAPLVAGILVEFEDGNDTSAIFSADSTFPQASFSGYGDGYVWNPTGSGLVHRAFDFPIFQLSPQSTVFAREVASKNRESNLQYPVHVAEFDLVMQTTKSGTRTSKSCLEERSCLPLGGYSVLSGLPPLNSSAASGKPIVLAMASMDSMSLFRDLTPGADSPLSGMIALLAAVDALGRGASAHLWKMQVVFLFLAGEPWGYIGSRQFFASLSANAPSLAGLDASRIHQILEIGSVGRASNVGSTTLYAHKQPGQAGESAAVTAILDALQASAGVPGSSIEVKNASRSNPGLPPSSLSYFLHKVIPYLIALYYSTCHRVSLKFYNALQNETFAGVLLEEFDTVFVNPAFHSHFDTHVNVTSLAESARLLARTLYTLASDSASDVAAVDVNETLVQELVNCLLKVDQEVVCDLADKYSISAPRSASHYVGVVIGKPMANPFLETVSYTSQFIWNFLASYGFRLDEQFEQKTAAGQQPAECSGTCSGHGEICVGSTAEGKGVCLPSSTRYIPAYSPRLHYGDGGWELVPAAAEDFMGAVDPVWTESFWRTTGLQLFMQDSGSFDNLVLLSGVCTTAVSLLAIACTKALFRKRLKEA